MEWRKRVVEIRGIDVSISEWAGLFRVVISEDEMSVRNTESRVGW